MKDRLAAYDRIPPQSLEMEQATLGAMLIETAAIEKAAEILRPGDFYRDAHRVIFEAILKLHGGGQPVGILEVQEQLRLQEDLEGIGAAPYLIQLTDAVPTAASVNYYAAIVRDKALLRQLLDGSGQLQALAHSEYDDIEQILAAASRIWQQIEERGSGSDSITAGEIGGDEIPAAKPIPSLWFGCYAGRAHLLIGETGAGKSAFLYNLAIAAARNESLWNIDFRLGRPLRVYYVDPENAGDYRATNGQRDGGICAQKIRNILGETGKLPPTIRFADGHNLNLSNPSHVHLLVRRARRGIGDKPFDLIVLDPIVALFGISDENDNAEMGRVAETIRQISRMTGAAVVAAHHTGKAVQLNYGVLSGRGASALAGAMDVVMTLRVRGEDEQDRDEEWTGETRVRDAICRIRIEKDRSPDFGKTAALYLGMGRPRVDCFERVRFSEWHEAGRSEREGPNGPKKDQAKPYIRATLEGGEFMARGAIQREVREAASAAGVQLGRNVIDEALADMERDGEIESACIGGATKCFRLKDPFKE